MSSWCTGSIRSCRLQDSDLHRIIRHFELDPSKLAADITGALDKLPRGATSISDLSQHVEDAVERGWVFGTLMFGESQVRTGHLLLGALKTTTLRNALYAISRQFELVKAGDAVRPVRRDRRQLAGERAGGERRIARRRAGRGLRRHGAGADGQAGGTAAILRRSDRAGAQR